MKPKVCFRCGEISTFCECDHPIYDKDEYIEALEESLAKDGETITMLRAENKFLKKMIKRTVTEH